ncbi:MAG: UDP-N-acetylmuramoyl-L-alanyl-D-glutamate--2,6-diaminopimelate ligase [Bdellovibrionales bacterium]|nr:UDP-N-acetylmuramoyl-L-alanyl-D-glutamate--2,6-diaminopimelate ligase [Bdellovibrionales bacterium]
MLGTIDHHIKTHVWKTSLTTPNAIDLNRRLQEMQALGAKAVVFEVSSHALDQKRVDGVNFDVAIFTNLTRDHMDYHKDMPTYFKAKQRLFSEVLLASKKDQTYAVINSDSSYGKQIQVAAKAKPVYYGESAEDFKFTITKQDIQSIEFELHYQGKQYTVNLPMVGAHNAYNATAAIACCNSLGVSVETCIKALENFKGVPGRLERVEIDKNVNAFVDYAHTDQALASVLNTLLEVKTEKNLPELITVFGCGGDRDKGKRPLMLEAALNYSDKVYLTSDNPRTEDPMTIIEDCLTTDKYTAKSSNVIVEVDRKKAIHRAINEAEEGAVILVAGKGHEDYQIIGTEKKNFSDIECIKESLSE